MIKISATIITLNEEKNIGRCLESLQGLADEVVVVDSFSSDKTKEICLSYGAKFIEQKFLGYRDQKNLAQNMAQYDYVLSLDADEVISSELRAEILRVKNQFEHNGYEFSRLTNYNGNWIRHCGWYPDKKIRLVKKDKGRWGGENIHEGMVVDGPVSLLKGDLLHYSYDSISAHVIQANKFSTMEAIAHYNKGKRATLAKLVTRAPLQFFKDYFLKLGILDGRYGFVICFINAMYVLLKYAKMMDLENSKKI